MTRARRPNFVQEGAEAAWRFEHAMSRILRVSREELDKREADYQESRKGKARPGPKPVKKSRHA